MLPDKAARRLAGVKWRVKTQMKDIMKPIPQTTDVPDHTRRAIYEWNYCLVSGG
jgi:hypothetical protein